MNQKQRDILCSMLKKRTIEVRKQLDAQFCLVGNDRYGLSRSMERHPECLDQLSVVHRKRYKSLTLTGEKIDAQQAALRTDWDKLFNEILKDGAKHEAAQQMAIKKLDDAMENAVIEVQFALNVDEARAVMDSLPTIEQLMTT